MTEITSKDTQRRSGDIQGPHLDLDPDSNQLTSIKFKYEFAQTCATEARTFPPGSSEYKENMGYALEFLDSALDDSPHNPKFHFQRGLLAAELGESTSAVSSFRNAVIHDPANAQTYMHVLHLGSEEINKTSPGTISKTTLQIQSDITSGEYESAFRTAHQYINESISQKAAPDLWHVQLMRVAAMQIGAERTYVEVLNHLEQNEILSASDVEYLPTGYKLTTTMKQALQQDDSVSSATPARSNIWKALERYDHVKPINSVAVKVGPGSNGNR